MMYLEKPDDFNSEFEVVSCFVEDPDGCIVLLQRAAHVSGCGMWSSPTGKVEVGETPVEAIRRELNEELKYDGAIHDFEHVRTTYITYPEYSFTYYIFKVHLPVRHRVVLDDASQDFRWVTSLEALAFNLIEDEAECIQLAYGNPGL